MKRFFYLMLLCCVAIFSSATEPVKILAIGNSFSEDAIEQNLSELASAAGYTTIIGNLYIPGCSLERHYDNAARNNEAYRYRKIGTDNKTVETNKVTLERPSKTKSGTTSVCSRPAISPVCGTPTSLTCMNLSAMFTVWRPKLKSSGIRRGLMRKVPTTAASRIMANARSGCTSRLSSAREKP